jgi:chorismate mutase
MVRGVRGAITITEDTPEEIIRATQEMLTTMMDKNGFAVEDVVSAIFTVTPDITSEFPARSARLMGWTHVPLMCSQEIPVPGALPRCIRVLLHVNTDKSQAEVKHAYLRGAAVLRKDIAD